MGLRLGPWRPQTPGIGGKGGGAHLAGACLGLADLGVAVTAAAFTGAQVEAAGHACVACVTVLGTARGASSGSALGRDRRMAGVGLGRWES